MTMYRVKAYYMHEHEEAAARQAESNAQIADAEWTPSFVMGVVDDAGIKSLQKKGLVVSLVEEVASGAGAAAAVQSARALASVPAAGVLGVNVPAAMHAARRDLRPVPMTMANQSPRSKVVSSAPRKTDYYVVRFHGPITPDREKELRKAGIRLLERLTRNKYTVRLKPSDVKSLADLPFVDFLRLYTAEDTLRVPAAEDVTAGESPSIAAIPRTATRAATRAAKPRGRTCVYAVKLHQAKYLPGVVKWLASRNRKPLWKRGDQLQVALVEGSKMLADLARRSEVAVIEKVETPRLYDEPARTLLGLAKNNVNLGLKGEGEIIGIADTGIDITHADLKQRLAGTSAWGRTGDVSDPEGHGTHVAGCAAGEGKASQGEVMGAAPQAKIFFQSILDASGGLGGLPSDLGELFAEAYAKGARIHNNSWGAFNFARYSNTSLDVDRFVADHPDMLIVIAAGNDGIGVPRAIGAHMCAAQGFVDWPCVAAPATAKNGLTVGASRNSRTTGGYSQLKWSEAWPDRYPHAPIADQRISSKHECLAAFSSRGPSDDLRFKPDVVAPGTDIAAAKSKDAPLHKFWGAYPGNAQYGYMGGTSMAAPYVAGCAALVREWYRKKGAWATPSAALLKATLINGSRRITGPDATAPLPGDPNYHQGFGRIDMAGTLPNQQTPKLKLAFDDTWKTPDRIFKQTGQRFRYRIKVGKDAPLRICLAWTDPGARGLQNSLVLLVDNSAAKKWVGNSQAATLLNIAGGPRDPNNNVQVVRIDAPTPGEYTIAIAASMLLVPPQSFALVVTGDLKSSLVPAP